MSLHSFREKVNLHLFSSKNIVLMAFRILRVLVLVIATGTLIRFYGFPHDEAMKEFQLDIIKYTFAFYVLNYFVRFLYTFEPRNFLKVTWFECSLVVLIILDGIGGLFHLTPIQTFFRSVGFNNYHALYIIFIQSFLLVIILIQVTKASSFFSDFKMGPAPLFMISFIILIATGMGLLMLPEMTNAGHSISWLNALFTSTSACCVTGLSVVDTATVFSLKGKMILMVLIQLGGLSIISFATFFATFSSQGSGIKHQSLMKEYFSTDSLLQSKGMLRQIITMSFLIEGFGSLLVFSLWDKSVPFHSIWEKIFYSIFHSVSAFNNAGFSLFTDKLHNPLVKNSYILHLAIASLIFFGSLGFSAIRDLFTPAKLRERLKLRWKNLSISTRIALYSSISLILFGGVCIFLLERNNALAGQKPVEAIIISLFQSITCRTAGFNTVNVAALHIPTLMIMMFLMFIGASSGSTGGGIKTSTFYILLVSAYNTIRGKRQLELFNHSISFDLLNKAFTILIFAVSYLFFATFLLSITEPGMNILHLAFEEVSAFSTVGLSTGITSGLSSLGKGVLLLSMFIGRIGPLTLAFSLSRRVTTTNYKYPDAHFMVG